MAKEKCCPDGTFIDYAATNYFSKIVLDYIRGADALRPFYAHRPDMAGIEAAITAKKGFSTAIRKVLVDNMRSHYEKSGQLAAYKKVEANIEALGSSNTFTVTTAHQPNIFGGPLYLVYKILHVIQLAEMLNATYKEQQKYFVPFYYMGSEDADLDEIGQMQVDGKKYVWQTDQTGPVGRMKIDKKLLALIDELEGQVGVGAYGPEFIRILRDCYREGRLIQEATFAFIHQLFGRYGLLILMPDDRQLKEVFEPVVLKELKEGFSHKALERTTANIEKAGYKVQTHGRPINLFYQEGHHRERIIKDGDVYRIDGRDATRSRAEIEKEVKDRAELFSGNVVLRGPFQETILPDIAFVGGGGELAYWLEMKGVYEAAGIPYPVLLLRNSFMLLTPKETVLMHKLALQPADLFLPLHQIQDLLLKKKGVEIDLSGELEQLSQLYAKIGLKAAAVDSTLAGHTEAIATAARNKAHRLVTKMKTAQRKRLETETGQLRKLKERLFPAGSLQERTENIAGFYAQYGKDIFDLIKARSLTLEQQFGVIHLPEPVQPDPVVYSEV